MGEGNQNRFGDHINALRRKYDITLEQLCEGLCTPSHLAKLEKGERQPNQLLQGQLLARLGVIPSDYENLLDKEKYDRWRKRQRILHEIRERHWDAVKELLERYGQEYGAEKDPQGRGEKALEEERKDRKTNQKRDQEKKLEQDLERQFYLAVSGLYLQNTGDRKGAAERYREAMCLTMPRIGEKDLLRRVLSAQEVNLILEYYHHSEKESRGKMYQTLLRYIENPRFDQSSRAKMYPKTVYYLWEYWGRQTEIPAEQYRWLLERCDQGIEMLRDDLSLYYMWELLDMRQEILQRWEEGKMPVIHHADGGDGTAVWFAKRMAEQTQMSEWKRMIEDGCREFGIPVKMYEFCYLYDENEVYCIGDVIRKRREMLGMSRNQLCENICSAKTLSRLENHKTKPQREIVEELLERLGLPPEYCRTELVTSDPEAKRMMRELRRRTNEGRYEDVDRLLEKIKERVSMDIPFNRQVLARYHALNERGKGTISLEEYIRRMTEALEYTLPLEAALSEGEKYMTNEELQCVHNLVQHQNTEDLLTERCVRMLAEFYHGCENEGLVAAYFSMYSIVMTRIASYIGNKGMYDRSDEISRRIRKESLLCHEMNLIDHSIYNIMWNRNHRQRKKEEIPFHEKRDSIEDLKKCIAWSELTKHQYGIRFYVTKLNTLKSR